MPRTLWDQVTATFGNINPSTKAFASKLAHKQKWKQHFALKAVAEYKRFVYLGIVSDFVVTPSEVIDKVWHEHLLFSKAYRIFCNDIIQYEFDHTPSLINIADQTGMFSAQYLDTLALYKKEFGVAPPEVNWGKPKFDEDELSPTKYQSKKKEKSFDTIEVNNYNSTYNASNSSNEVNDNSAAGLLDLENKNKRQNNTSVYSDEFPLCTYFDTPAGESFGDFGGFEGGDGGGGGAGGSWGDSSSDSSDSSGSDGGGGSCSGGCGGGD